MSEVNQALNCSWDDIKSDLDETEGQLPTKDMRKGLGFNMRFLSVPAS